MKLITTQDYLLGVDDSEIKEGDLYVTNGQVIKHDGRHKKGQGLKPIAWFGGKIIAHLPLNDSPILEGVYLLPPLEQEDDVEKIAREEILYNDAKRGWWKQGYNKAKEKYKYTKEDMRRAFLSGVGITGEGYNAEYNDGNDPDIETEFGEQADKFIQSISQPKMPVEFKIESTTINAQGQTIF